MSFTSTLHEAFTFKNMIFMVKCICVRAPSLPGLATVLVLQTSGKPSTKFPLEGLVDCPLKSLHIISLIRFYFFHFFKKDL